jgi:hypothetical protein
MQNLFGCERLLRAEKQSFNHSFQGDHDTKFEISADFAPENHLFSREFESAKTRG